ncbi:hypothetical protein HMPREF2617_10505 [Corynebacterium sp. HMSC070H05]|uniref:hypothetical protein n=1 Tax=Corynebacterium sp. HMSC070H05 TaxID=1715096 RepID=UPI0008A9A98D|nr:hypothetical protein [Corynebacterium sp. HMSC070H05]OHQ52612.1 hypothetical protein HMPREF2617_10505 [Corynebacterium sp. HMSC070H05]
MDNELLAQMTRAYEAWMPRQLRDWYPRDERLRLARKEMRPHAEHVANREFGVGFRDHLNSIDGPNVKDPLAWANRHVKFADGHWCVAGIRFLGLDPKKPFVHVVATSVPPELDGLAPYAQHLHNEFADFAPVAIRFELPNPPESADVDQWIVAGLVSELRASPRRPLSDQVRLIPAAPEDMVEYADDVLGNVVKQTPDVATWTEAATLPQLQSCAETGALCAVEVGGQRAGVIAAARDDANGMRGFQVYEFLLDDHARGRGLAPAAMQHLCSVLPAHPGDTLWGTIHAGNGPSLGNALAVGRKKIAAFVWVARRGDL